MNQKNASSYLTLYEGFSFLDFLSQIYPGFIFDSQWEANNVALNTDQLDQYYEQYKQVVFFDLNKEWIKIDKSLQFSEKTAYAFHALVLRQDVDGLLVGFVNPFNFDLVQNVQNRLATLIKPVMVKENDLKRILRLTFRKIEAIQAYAEKIEIKTQRVETVELINHNEDEQISDLAYLIIRDAVEIEASDIHLEVNEISANIRLRIDGALQKYSLNNAIVGDHLLRYFKLLADVDITQEQKPTEGRKVAIKVNEQDINLRLSFMPTYDGQSVVIRILGTADSYKLAAKIKNKTYLKEIKEYLARSYGMFLISGPTGSGKTTTLYSSIQEINLSDKKIITLEDPVEAKIPDVCQIQVNEMIHYSFAEGLRSALRQDPDVIMIGEIRDEVTANMAVRAAITGHLVLSTVHARGVSEIPIRLLNLKVDPYLLASALRLTVSQRLVRKICPNCKVLSAPSEVEMAFIEKHKEWSSYSSSFYRGQGCHYCQNTGFLQREAIFEILHISPEMITSLSLNAVAEYMKLVKEVMQGRTLLDNAFALALEGLIPLSEVLRMESD